MEANVEVKMDPGTARRGRTIEIPIEHETQVGEARRSAQTLARESGMSESEASDVAIAATEMASNVWKHASRGSLLVHRARKSLELVAIDQGPGMADPARCFSDGYSTAGTPGNGLGAVRRLAARMDFHSQSTAGAGHGTVLWAEFRAKDEAVEAAPADDGFEIGSLCIPYPGETHWGDAWLAVENPDGSLALTVADGLGHGPLAQTASLEAIAASERNASLPPSRQLELAHAALRSTRGAAVGIARIEPGRDTLSFAGVGNTVGAVVDAGGSKRVVSYDGTVGLQIRKIQEFTYAFPKRAVFVLHSDGVSSSWDLGRYPGVLRRHPAVIAALIYRDCARRRDDATITVVSRKVVE